MYVCMYVCMCICMLWLTSALASSVCGRCMFISSPSKSALYGVQAHSKTAYVNVQYVCTCMYVCMYICVYVYVNVCMFLHLIDVIATDFFGERHDLGN